MTRAEDYSTAVDAIIGAKFNSRYGRTVPTTDSVALVDGGVYLDAAYLYADMTDSSGLAQQFTAETAARIVRSYLGVVTRVIRHHGGEIRSYDGDRVMALFVGEGSATHAISAALEITWVVDNILHTSLLMLDEYFRSAWTVRHRTGIDMGTAFIVRAGVRGSNDLVSIGNPPNVAAKLSSQNGSRTYITEAVWQAAGYRECFDGYGDDARAIWSQPEWISVGSRRIEVRHSNWRRVVG